MSSGFRTVGIYTYHETIFHNFSMYVSQRKETLCMYLCFSGMQNHSWWLKNVGGTIRIITKEKRDHGHHLPRVIDSELLHVLCVQAFLLVVFPTLTGQQRTKDVELFRENVLFVNYLIVLQILLELCEDCSIMQSSGERGYESN